MISKKFQNGLIKEFEIRQQLNSSSMLWISCSQIFEIFFLVYFQSKINPDIDPTCRLRPQANETLYHLLTDYEATSLIQVDILKYKITLPDMTWNVKELDKFIQHPLIHSLRTIQHREIEYIDHNCSLDASSLWA